MRVSIQPPAQDVPALRESYAEWVRRIVARSRDDRTIVPLFDSSVPEPRALLAEAIATAFTAPVTARYTSAFAGGNPYVVEHLCRRYGVGADHVLCTTGATGALALLYRVLVRPGERVLVETPGFDLFHGIAADRGIAVDRFVRAAPDFALDLAAVEAALRPETRLIVLSNLHNPSGVAIDHAAMIALARLAERRHLLVIVDEVYGDYADAGARPAPAAILSPHMLSISSLTKIFGLSTLRCGWIVGDPGVMAPLRRHAERLEFGLSNLSHAVAALVMDDAPRYTAYTDRLVDAGRAMTEEYFDRWRRAGLIEGAVPPHGCIAFPRLTRIADTARFSETLAAETGVVVAPGEYFGLAGHIRIGFGLPSDVLGKGLRSLSDAIA